MYQNPLRLLNVSDRICGIVGVAAAIFLFVNARDLPFGTVSTPDAGFFPKILSVLLAVFGLGLALWPRSPTESAVARASLVQDSLPEDDAQPSEGFTARSWAVPVAAAVLLAYSALLDRAGFILSTTAVLFLLMTVYGRLRWTIALATSVSVVIVCYLGFTELGVPLPQGVLTLF